MGIASAGATRQITGSNTLAGAGGAGLVGGITGSIGGGISSAMDRALTRENRQFQLDMSNTAYQRAMRDMRAAGLNPILAYKQGGASTPTPNAFKPSSIGLREGVSTAIALQRARAEVKNIGQTTKQSKANTDLLTYQAEKARLEAALYGAVNDLIGDPLSTGKDVLKRSYEEKIRPKFRELEKTWDSGKAKAKKFYDEFWPDKD